MVGFRCVSPITVKLNASPGSAAVMNVSTPLCVTRPSASVQLTW